MKLPPFIHSEIGCRVLKKSPIPTSYPLCPSNIETEFVEIVDWSLQSII